MSTSLGFDVFANDRGASRTFLGLGRSMDTTGTKLRTLGRIGATAALGLAAGVGVASVAAFKLAQGAAEDEQAATALAVSLRNATGATAAQVSSTESWITSMGVARGVADDELRPALGKLAVATGDIGEAQRLASLAMDVSAGTGKSLETVTTALAKAQTGSVAGLGKLGVATKDAAGETLSLEQITGSLAQKFAGQSAAAADTTAGRYERLKLVLAETGEAVGYKLLPPLTAAAGWILSNGVPVVNKLWRALEKNGIDGLVGKVEKLTGTQGQLVPVWELVKQVAGDVATIFTGAIIPAFTGAGGAATGLASPLSYADDVLGFMADHTNILKAALIGYVAVTGAARAVTLAKNVVDAVQLGLLMARTPGTAAYTAVTLASSAATGIWTGAQWLLNAALTANPIGIVVVAIAAMVAGLVIAYKKSDTFRAIVDTALRTAGKAGTWLWDNGLKPAFAALKIGFETVGKAGTWLWNNALQPAFKFIVGGMSTLLTIWSQMLATLGRVPGFGWANRASEAMAGAADKAASMAAGIKKIPESKTVIIKALTADAQRALASITAYKIPDKTFKVRASTNANLAEAASNRGGGGGGGGAGGGGSAGYSFGAAFRGAAAKEIEKLKGGGLKLNLRGDGAALIATLVEGIRSKKQDVATVMSSIRAEVKSASEALRDARAGVVSDFQSWQQSIFGADMGSDQPTTLDGLFAFAEAERSKAARVADAVRKLAAPGGLSTDLLTQLRGAGSAGYDALIALSGASSAQLARFNALDAGTRADYGRAAGGVNGALYGRGESPEEARQKLADALAEKLGEVLAQLGPGVAELRLSGDDLVATIAKKDRKTGRKPNRRGK